MKNISVGLVQQSCSDNLNENLDKSIAYIRAAHKQGAKLVVLQELHQTLYFCQTEDMAAFELAERIPGPATDTFGEIARELEIVIVISLFERRGPGVYHNTAVVIDSNGSIAGKYRKMHIPDDPGFYEKFYFTPGDLGFKPVDTSIGRLGVLVCWDQWYPEASRMMAINGAEMLIYPTAIGWEPSDTKDEKDRQLNAWTSIQQSHGVANGIPVISVNRVGFEKNPSAWGSSGIQFWGSSFAAGCQGEVLAKASADKEELLMVTIDLEKSEKVRRSWPFFRDRRIDAYQDVLKRYGN